MSDLTSRQVAAVAEATATVPTENFAVYGGGWPNEISTALVDAVFSIQAQYRSDTPGKGVFNRLQAFRCEYKSAVDDLTLLVEVGEAAIEAVMGNAKTSSRSKASAVIEAASNFLDIGVRTAEDFRAKNSGELKNAYVPVKGLGWITFEYLSMLLGQPGVKADTMICRFVNVALQQQGLDAVDGATARQLIALTHEQTGLGETLSHFDHGIWLFESDRASV